MTAVLLLIFSVKATNVTYYYYWQSESFFSFDVTTQKCRTFWCQLTSKFLLLFMKFTTHLTTF